MKVHLKNQLNDGNAIEFCCGEKEYKLLSEEEITIEINDDDCIYLDVVR